MAKLITATVLLGLALFIQPCPAPPAIPAVLVAFGSGVVTGGAIGIGGAIAGGRNRGSAKFKRDHIASASCMSELYQSPTPLIEMSENNTILIHHLPSCCVNEIEGYNTSPDIDHFNQIFGTTSVVNDTSIRMHDMPPSVYDVVMDTLGPLMPKSGYGYGYGAPEHNRTNARAASPRGRRPARALEGSV